MNTPTTCDSAIFAGDLTTCAIEPTNNLTWLQRASRRQLNNWLDQFTGGTLRWTDIDHHQKVCGQAAHDGLAADFTVLHPSTYSLLATRGSLGFAESYLRGEWRCSDLVSLLRLLTRNLPQLSSVDSGKATLWNLANRVFKRATRNTLSGSRRNIAAHYDLSNDFFELFLDPTLMYSSAYFERPEASLEEASEAKLRRTCQKLELAPTDKLLEIGTGWGGLALHAAVSSGCHVTTTTISNAQYNKAQHRFAESKVANQIQLLKKDYRHLAGQFDKVVSIEMIEAVGREYLGTFFAKCGSLLKPGGRLVLQAIVMPEQRYEAYSKGTDFIREYIFPGGHLPSVSAMQEAVADSTDLRLQSLEDMSIHYAHTLEHWRNRFWEQLAKVRALGFDDRFIRMWEYYLCYCEAAFREQAVQVVQVVWDKPRY